MSNLFAALQRVLLNGESLTFKISRSGDHLVALLLPEIPPLPSQFLATKEPAVDRARESLSLPLRLEGSAASLDADFVSRVHGYATARSKVCEGLDLVLTELDEAAKATRAAAAAQRGKRKALPAPTAPATPVKDPAAGAAHDTPSEAPSAPTPSRSTANALASESLSLF